MLFPPSLKLVFPICKEIDAHQNGWHTTNITSGASSSGDLKAVHEDVSEQASMHSSIVLSDAPLHVHEKGVPLACITSDASYSVDLKTVPDVLEDPLSPIHLTDDSRLPYKPQICSTLQFNFQDLKKRRQQRLSQLQSSNYICQRINAKRFIKAVIYVISLNYLKILFLSYHIQTLLLDVMVLHHWSCLNQKMRSEKQGL